jgi:hypothetical protein
MAVFLHVYVIYWEALFLLFGSSFLLQVQVYENFVIGLQYISIKYFINLLMVS